MKPASLVLVLFAALGLVATSQADTPDEIRARQKDEAEKLWTFTLTKGKKPAVHATDAFLFVGMADKKQLEALGAAAEKVLPAIKKTLLWDEKDPAWEGYIVVHVCKERPEFRSLYFRQKKARSAGDEGGFFVTQGSNVGIGLAPAASSSKKGFTPELELVNQLATALLVRKRGDTVPVWFQLGYGRSEAYRYAPKQAAGERQAAAMLASQGKTFYSVQGDDLMPYEKMVLSASLADFITHAAGMEKYWPDILKNLGGDRDFYGTLREVKLDHDLVQKSWAAWVKNPR